MRFVLVDSYLSQILKCVYLICIFT